MHVNPGLVFWAADEEVEPETIEDILADGVATLSISLRTLNQLESLGIIRIGDLMSRTSVEILSKGNFGESALLELFTAIRDRGIVDKTDKELKDMVKAHVAHFKASKLTAAGALARCLQQLNGVFDDVLRRKRLTQNSISATTGASTLDAVAEAVADFDEISGQLAWVIKYAKSRDVEPKELVDEKEIGKRKNTGNDN